MSKQNQVNEKKTELATLERKWRGHESGIWSIAVSPDGKRALTGSSDDTLKLWDLDSGECIMTFSGHKGTVYSVTLHPDGKRALSGSLDDTIKLWDLASGKCITTLQKHTNQVRSIAVTSDGKRIISCSTDKTIKLWNLSSGKCLNTFKGHQSYVSSVILTPDEKKCISASDDRTVKLWDLKSGECLRTFTGHSNYVYKVVIDNSGKKMLSGSGDNTLKLWDIESGKCLATFEGHTGSVFGVAISANGWLAASASLDETVKMWDIRTGQCLQTLQGEELFFSVAFIPDGSRLLVGDQRGNVYVWRIADVAVEKIAVEEPQVRYTCAKVALVGESGVGKSGLGYRLAEDRWQITDSTHGMQVWPLELPKQKQIDGNHEVLLWDFAGQPDYRLIHQLFFDETSLALIIFDATHPEDPFRGIGYWEKALKTAIGDDPNKLLIAARTDRGGTTITQGKINEFCEEHGFSAYIPASAKTGKGRKELLEAITKFIPWENLPWTSTTKLFKDIKDEIIKIKEDDIALIRFKELFDRLKGQLTEKFKEDDLRTVVKLMSGQGLIKQLAFGDFILLQPEQINNYASAVIREAREHVDGIGTILEKNVFESKIDFKDMDRLSIADEEILLRAMVQTFLDHALCFRESSPDGVQLVFPSKFNREMKDIPEHPNVMVKYQISGDLEVIYTTLVVRLFYSEGFKLKDLWRNAAEFVSPEKKKIGFKMEMKGEGVGTITVFSDNKVPKGTQAIFFQYVHEHLLKRSLEIKRERKYCCLKCGYPVKDKELIKRRLASTKKHVLCQDCEKKILLFDLIEKSFTQDVIAEDVQKLNEKADKKLSNESLEQLLEGHTMIIAAKANQIYRDLSKHDHGIDAEIEFFDKKHEATSKKIYLQLKCGDSYLRLRKGDGKEIFDVTKERHLKYWLKPHYDVYLVIRTSDEKIRWMNLTRYLKTRKSKTSKQIVFDGEDFNVKNLLKIRDKHLNS